jgi:hypothetical protein
MAPVTVTLAGGGSGDPSTMVIMVWHLGTLAPVSLVAGGSLVWWLGDPSTMVEMVAGEIDNPVTL